MSDIHSSDKQRSPLGYFMQGLPAVFVRTDIALSLDGRLSRYVNEAMRGHPDFSKDETLKGYELFVTTIHELRHFHDGLLSRPLFKLFLRQAARLHSILQLPKEVAALTASDIPFLYDNPITGDISPAGRALIKRVHRADQLSARELHALHRACPCLGNLTVSLPDILEANAVAAELLHLYVLHNASAVEAYYERLVRKLPPLYNKLVDAFAEIKGNLIEAVVALHLAVTHSLYGSDDPIARFCALAEEYARMPGRFLGRYGPEAVKSLFDAESELEAYVRGHRFIDDKGKLWMPPQGDWLQELYGFHERVYEARKLLITKYIGEFRMDAHEYFHRTNQLPLPPIVFWPGEDKDAEEITAVPEAPLQDSSREFYIIRRQKRKGGEWAVVAGMRSYITEEPFFFFSVVDMHMLAYYSYSRLFRGAAPSEVYSPTIDDMYEDLFHKCFNLS